MSSSEDMAACECRNGAGYPVIGQRSNINGSVDNSTNKALPWVVLIAVLASLALMGVLMMPMVIDAKVRAAVAPAEAKSELAMKTAYTAKDQIDFAIAKAKAKEGK